MSDPASASQLNSPVFKLAVTGGLGEGAKLRLQRMIEVTPKGIRFKGDMTLEQYQQLVAGWKMVRDAHDVGLADIYYYGLAHFGKEATDHSFGAANYDFNDQMRAIAIGQLSLDLRLSSNLTTEHFYILGKIETEKERGKWMALAEKHALTPHELQKSIEAGQVLHEDKISREQGTGSGINTVQGLGFWFERWEKQVGGAEKIFALPLENKLQLLRELKGPGELYLKLRDEVAATEAVAA